MSAALLAYETFGTCIEDPKRGAELLREGVDIGLPSIGCTTMKVCLTSILNCSLDDASSTVSYTI
jgi:hypothetical protein